MNTDHRRKWQVYVVSIIVLGLPVLGFSEPRKEKSDQLPAHEAQVYPVGHERSFYWDTLRNQGYRIIEEKMNMADHIVLAAAKPGQAISLIVHFAEDTGKSTGVVVRQLWPHPRTVREKPTGQREDVVWRQQKTILTQRLQPGLTLREYRDRLADLGWHIVMVKNNAADFVEYEVQKDDMICEVQFQLNEQTDVATQVDISRNVIKASATEKNQVASPEQEMSQTGTSEGSDVVPASGRQTAPGKALHASLHHFSDRDHTEHMLTVLRSLPLGKEKKFYRETLKQQGYRITEVNTNSLKELDLELIKNKKPLALTVYFDPETGKSTVIDASRVWWESATIAEGKNNTDRTETAVNQKKQTTTLSQTSSSQSQNDDAQKESSAYGDELEPRQFQTQAERDLEERIWTRLRKDENLASLVQNLQISADFGGKVTISGQVDNEEEKNQVANAVQKIKGVKDLRNRLHIEQQISQKQAETIAQ